MDRRIFLSDEREVTISCLECNRAKNLDVSKIKSIGKPLSARCPCGASFRVVFERRRHYRKATNLVGSYSKDNELNSLRRDMIIEDLSRSGALIRTLDNIDISVGDMLNLDFRLDGGSQSIIRAKAMVRSIEDSHIGVEFIFLPESSKKEIGFYLLP